MRSTHFSWTNLSRKLGLRRRRRNALRHLQYRRRARVESLEARTLLASDVYTVTTLADQFDGSELDGLSLREALVKAATDDATNDNDVIEFDESLFSGGAATILLGDVNGSGAIDGGE